jgi:hypothetical protein
MIFRYSTLIIAAYLYMDIFCTCALPVRLERQTSGISDLESTMKSSLEALRDIAVSDTDYCTSSCLHVLVQIYRDPDHTKLFSQQKYGLPINALFSETCHLLDNIKEVNNDTLQECQGNISNLNAHSIRSVICSLVSFTICMVVYTSLIWVDNWNSIYTHSFQ